MRHLPAATVAVLFAFVLAVSSEAAAVEPSATVPPDVQAYATALGDVLSTHVFEGDFTGDGADDALAFIYYAAPGGNAAFLDISLFESTAGGLVHKRVVQDVFGGSPRDVTVTQGQIQVTMTTLKPGEPRCCPTGETRYTIKP